MRPVKDNQSRFGFTIIELLTVMSIIVILISLLMPALNRVRRYATDVKQKAQLHAIAVALDAFNADFGSYPDSNAVDSSDSQGYSYAGGNNYGGAMRLAEALVGQDLKGFNPSSKFERRGYQNSTDAAWDGMPYPPYNSCGVTVGSSTVPGSTATGTSCYYDNVRSRKMYLELEHANAYHLGDIYDSSTLANAQTIGGPGASAKGFDPNTYVLCDSYTRVTNKTTGKKIGMPILYYKADSSKLQFPLSSETTTNMKSNATLNLYTYNVWDNQTLVDIQLPWASGSVSHLASGGQTMDGVSLGSIFPQPFYNIIRDPKVPTGDRPYRADSYILMSAGFDGDYGTADDIYNFGD
jgi:prepilin-type N-terminal cleavage/methylation domain-containing protein